MTLRSSGGYDPQRSWRPVVLHDCGGTGAHALELARLVAVPGSADRLGGCAVSALTFADAQRRAWEIKQAKGFNTTSVEREFCFAMKELGEAFDAWRLGRADAGEELADVAIFILALATMTGADLGAEVDAKLDKVVAREYVALPSGELVKAAGR